LLPLPQGDDSRDGGGRATQEAKAEGWGEGIGRAYCISLILSFSLREKGRPDSAVYII